MALAPVARIGRGTLFGLSRIGRSLRFALGAVARIPLCLRHQRQIARAFWQVVWQSLPVIGLTAVFTGAALALQIHAGGSRIAAEAVVPQIVAVGILRELGPVMVGLMVVARVTAAMAAEIATMKVGDEVDALVTLSVDPVTWLVAPRLLAGVIGLPVLVCLGDILGIAGGWGVATTVLDFPGPAYVRASWAFLTASDLWLSLTKAAVFGLIAILAAGQAGLSAEGGPEGVGRATTGAVGRAALAILAANVALSALFLS
nr:ABC transporter permease [Maritimibacter sp. DP1N21-5]